MKIGKYTIDQIVSNKFRLYDERENEVIRFTAEWNEGLYFKIDNITKNNRFYQAWRYFYKYIPIVREASYILALNGYIWDYKNNCNAKKYYENN